MIELNPTLLADLILSGYKYMIYIGKEDHGLFHPLKAQAPAIVVAALGAWQLPITEKEFQEMADGEEVIDFRFYIDERLFNDN